MVQKYSEAISLPSQGTLADRLVPTSIMKSINTVRLKIHWIIFSQAI